MNDLVRNLCEKDHKVTIVLRPEHTVSAFKKCLDRGYVHVKFPDTRGGTELGVRLDPSASDLTQADFEREAGMVTLNGTLKLDYVPVRCIAKVELKTLEGRGYLEVVES
jgi:hypothetical protein